MRAEWEPDELIDAWTLVEGDWEIVGRRPEQPGSVSRWSWSSTRSGRRDLRGAPPLGTGRPSDAQPGTEGRW